jgi:hypothetical protein
MSISDGVTSKFPMEQRRISRRRAIRLGVGAAAGVTLSNAVWVKPAVASVTLKHGCFASQLPGNPEVEVWKNAKVVRRLRKNLTVSGTLKIRNVSQFQVVVEQLVDTIQYKYRGRWKDAPTVFRSLSGCGTASCLDAGKRCTGDYVVTAIVPLSADKFRNHVEVKLMNATKIFEYLAEVEQDLVHVSPPEASPIEIPAGLPSGQPSP